MPAIGYLFELAGAVAPSLLNFYLARMNPASWDQIKAGNVSTTANIRK
ncbi:MAG: hypothetical protein QM757_46925 [Paludibaculum sp.]